MRRKSQKEHHQLLSLYLLFSSSSLSSSSSASSSFVEEGIIVKRTGIVHQYTTLIHFMHLTVAIIGLRQTYTCTTLYTYLYSVVWNYPTHLICVRALPCNVVTERSVIKESWFKGQPIPVLGGLLPSWTARRRFSRPTLLGYISCR